MAEVVRGAGFSVDAAGSLAAARDLVSHRPPDVALVDLSLPDGSGLEVLGELATGPATEIVVVTGHASVGSAVDALRAGASDYLTKPVDVHRLKAVLAQVARRRELHDEIAGLRTELRKLGRFGPLIGTAAPMQDVYDLIARVAPTDAVVFVQGASGTGKELVARTIHQLSRRRKQVFVALNCGAVSPQLIESELFGHERGSFTGADRAHRGYFERASGGTLLLDEITEMPVTLQVKLLRALETGAITRIGAEQETAVNVRIVAATNRDPEDAVSQGKLRADLLYRLNVFPIRLPALRERKEDIELLVTSFLGELNRGEDGEKQLTRAALERLQSYEWPGNVRELRNVVERAFIMADREIDPAVLALPGQVEGSRGAGGGSEGAWLRVRVGQSIADAERELILATLDAHGGDKETAAEVLGISVKTLYNRLKIYKATGTADVKAADAVDPDRP
jgi:DNA-binding NtrC family response regulator